MKAPGSKLIGLKSSGQVLYHSVALVHSVQDCEAVITITLCIQVKLSYGNNYYMSSGFALVLYTLHQIFVLYCGIVDNKVILYVVQKV